MVSTHPKSDWDMRTRRTQYTHLEILRSPEIQLQIAKDAKLARRIDNRFHSPIKKSNKEDNKEDNKKPSIMSRRLAFGRGAGLKEPLRKDACMMKSQAQASDIPVVAAVEHLQAHSEDSSSSGEQEQELEATPRSATKRLLSLFKAQTKVQGADKMEEADQAPVIATVVSDSGEDAQANIAQSVPAHLRQEYAASVV